MFWLKDGVNNRLPAATAYIGYNHNTRHRYAPQVCTAFKRVFLDAKICIINRYILYFRMISETADA